jgi:hypothetical protein
MPDRRPLIRVLPMDLARILDGHTMGVDDEQGNSYDVRLFTAQEFLVAQHASVDKYRPGNTDAKIDLARARELTGDRS